MGKIHKKTLLGGPSAPPEPPSFCEGLRPSHSPKKRRMTGIKSGVGAKIGKNRKYSFVCWADFKLF